MLFGDKENYGIEAYIDDPERIFGSMCLYFPNNVLGDIEYRYNCLFSAYTTLLKSSSNIENLTLPNALASENTVQIFNTIDNALYNYDESTEELSYQEIIVLRNEFYKYDFLTQGGINFDGMTSFIYFRPQNEVVVLSKGYATDGEVKESIVEKQRFIEISFQFTQWYQQECKEIGIEV